MIAPLARVAATLTLVIAAASLAACTPEPAPTPTADTVPTTAPPTTPEPEPTEEPDPVAEGPTCETLVSASLVAELTDYGWTAEDEPFMIGPDTVDGGLQCTWADYDGAASDNVLVFGWAPIFTSESTRLQAELLSQGWLREDGAEGIYITIDPDYAVAPDENGYGMTYLFGDGWVQLASTKQGLLLIEWDLPK